MTPRLVPLPFSRYAQAVLPHTHALWGHTQTFEQYVERNKRLAQSPYGKKHYTLFALEDGGNVLASFKRYERDARRGEERLRAIGIGAVFTPQEFRGSGNATAMLAMALDAARAGGFDFAFLYSDIHPQFYRELGFSELPSRTLSVRADGFSASRIRAEQIGARDWSGVRETFEHNEAQRAFAFVRSPLFWSLVRLRAENGDNLLVRDGKTIAAYLLGRREPRHDAYVIDELAYADEKYKPLAEALLRCAAGDLRRITGWLPPLPARRLLPRGSVRPRSQGMLMAAPLSKSGKRYVEAAAERSAGDPVWIADHV